MTIRIEFDPRFYEFVNRLLALHNDVRELRQHVEDIDRRLKRAGEVRWPK